MDWLQTMIEAEENYMPEQTMKYMMEQDTIKSDIARRYLWFFNPLKKDYFSFDYQLGRVLNRQRKNGSLTKNDLSLIFKEKNWLRPNPKDSAELVSGLSDTTCTKNNLLTILIASSHLYLDSLRYYNDEFRKEIK